MQFSSRMLGLLLGVVLLSSAGCTAPPENSSETEQQVKAPLLVKEIDQIAEKITVRIDDVPYPGSGVIVAREKGFFNNTYYVLTAKHVVKVNEFTIFAPDGKKHKLYPKDVTDVPNADLALVKFTSNQDYAVATLSSYDFENRNAWLNKSKSSVLAFVSGFPDSKQEKSFKLNQRLFTAGFLYNKLDSLFLVDQEGFVKDSDEYARTYEYAYSNITYRGMSGSPILNSSGQVVGIHGRNTGETTENGRRMILGVSLGVPIVSFLKSSAAKETNLKIDNSAPTRLAEKVSGEKLLPFRRSQCEDLVDCLNYSNELMRVGDYQSALLLIQKLTKQNSDFYPAWYLQGKILLVLGKNKSESEIALASYERAIKLKPDYYPAWSSRCYVLKYQLERSEDALECLDSLLRKQPQEFNVWHSRGEVLIDLKRYQEALSSFDQAIKIRPNSHSYYNRGGIRIDFKDFQGAIDDYTKAIQLNPNYAPAYVNRGSALFQTNNCKRAIPDLNEALRIDSSNPDIVLNTKALRGQCLFNLGNKKGGIQDLEAAIEIGSNREDVRNTQLLIEVLISIDVNNSNAYFQRAYIWDNGGHYSEAIRDYTKVIQINSRFIQAAFTNRGLIKLKNLNDTEGAIQDFSQAIKTDSNQPFPYLVRGYARFLISKVEMDSLAGLFHSKYLLESVEAEAR